MVAEAGTVHHLSLDEIRGAIEELGYTPRQRNVHYELIGEEHERRAVDASRARYHEIRNRQAVPRVSRMPELVPLTIVRGDSTA